jgi:CheY-like chemotaxis protein
MSHPGRKREKRSAVPDRILGQEFGVGSRVLGSLKRYAARLKAEPKRPLTVLIVDDDRAVLTFVERVLSEAGYQTKTATNGPDAIQLARQTPIDLLLTDVNMPQMTGDELARRLRHDEPTLKVLYLTGYSDQLFRDKTTPWQDEAYLEKPCTIAGLLEAVSLITVGRVEPS